MDLDLQFSITLYHNNYIMTKIKYNNFNAMCYHTLILVRMIIFDLSG